MRSFATFVTLVALALCTGGCTRTYISTGDTGVPCPDSSSTRICWTIHGAYGRSFVERTKKSVDVCIKRGHQQERKILFLQTYKFVGGDADAEAQWTSPEQVIFRVRDGRTATASNVLTLTFALDKKTRKFTEKR